MKIVIDVPKDRYEEICGGIFDADGYFKLNLTLAFRNGTPLPDNATNGDMIKALFPDIKVYRCNGCAHPSDKTSVLLEHMLSSNWWNAPYKGGDTDEKHQKTV